MLIAAAVLLQGQAVVSYEIFTGRTLPRRGLWRHWRSAVILAAGYGVVDEFHQSMVIGRVASIGDLLADWGGALLAVPIYAWLVARRTRSRELSER